MLLISFNGVFYGFYGFSMVSYMVFSMGLYMLFFLVILMVFLRYLLIFFFVKPIGFCELQVSFCWVLWCFFFS